VPFVTLSIDEALLLVGRIPAFSLRRGRIAADIKVDLPRPRASQSPGFTAPARELHRLVGADREIEQDDFWRKRCPTRPPTTA
jgi:NitT/TauT family transport system ATP-binding protein